MNKYIVFKIIDCPTQKDIGRGRFEEVDLEEAIIDILTRRPYSVYANAVAGDLGGSNDLGLHNVDNSPKECVYQGKDLTKDNVCPHN